MLLVCNNCLRNGIKQTIAELLPSGYISIERRHHKIDGYDHTVITGSDFSLICGNCGNTIMKRERRENELFGFRQSWIFRGTPMQEVGTIGTQNL
jgi:hypothetical protein